MKQLSSLILSIFLGFQMLSQSANITGNVPICVGDTLELRLKIVGDSSKYSYIWDRNGTPINASDSVYIKPSVSLADTGIYHCQVIKKLTSSNLNSVQSRTSSDTMIYSVTKKVTINDLPKLIGKGPSYLVEENNIILLASTNNQNLDFKWTDPEGKIYQNQVQVLENVGLKQLGEYTLSINDKKTKCKNQYKLDIGAKNVESQPKVENVFGTTEDMGESKEIMRMTVTNFPVYECNILGEQQSLKYVESTYGVTWEVIGQKGSQVIIKFIPYFYDNLDNLKLEIEGYRADLKYYEKELKRMQKELLSPNTSSATTQDSISKVKKEINKTESTIEGFEYHLKKYKYLVYYTDEKLSKRKYFLANRTDFEARTKKYQYTSKLLRPSFTAGTVLIPVKLRFNNFEFSKDVTLGPFIGAKWLVNRFHPYYFSLGITSGISSVRLTKANTDTDIIDEVQDIAAFSYSIGAIFEFNNVQLGLFAGKDAINNNRTRNDQMGYNWKYQDKWWLSIGFGYSIISRPTQKAGGPRK